MRNLEAVDRDLAAARETLSKVEGTPAEVYSRIVGYYRSVRNWNRGKREEYHERKLFQIDNGNLSGNTASPAFFSPVENSAEIRQVFAFGEEKLILFVRSSCPACPSAKAAAEKLGIPLELVNTDTQEGMDKALMFDVMATPTAILFNNEGKEINRARDSAGIAAMTALFAAVQ